MSNGENNEVNSHNTLYEVVYARFLSKIRDYEILNLEQEDITEVLHEYLVSAITHFNICKQDISSSNRTNISFNVTLTDQEIEILAILMLYQWLNTKVYTTELLKQHLSSRDYRTYSQAAFLKEMLDLRRKVKMESQQMLGNYSYSKFNPKLW